KKVLQISKINYFCIMPQAHMEHIKSEAGFKALFQFATIGIVVIGQKGLIELLNPCAEKLFGYGNSELIDQPIEVLIPDGLRLPKVSPMGLSLELIAKKKDGTIFPIEISLGSYELENETLAVAFVTDISVRKRNELELQKAKEAIESVNRDVSDYKFALDESSIVAVTDQRGIIQHVNDNFCKISKYTQEELIGQDHRIINSGHHSKEFIKNLWTTIAKGNIWKGELKNKAKDGTIYWVDTTIVPFLNEEGKPYKYLAIRSDITQRKQAELELQKSKEELEDRVEARTLELTAALEREKDLSEMKTRFVSMASHEFRTPLSAILSSSSLIEQYGKLGQIDKQDKHLKRIKSSVDNLVSILNDFLSLDKIEQGKIEVNQEIFDLTDFAKDVQEELRGYFKPGQHIKYTHSGEQKICQDKKILRNVLLNLLSNACKYSGENKEITFSTEVSNKTITIKVADKGIGIPESEQKNLFGKFYRAKNATNIQGTGLGLNIVKRYVELIDGNIGFISIENEGTTFTVTFPQNINQ
ncbi:MAG TPA: PAS domain-containing sensor histidine kinase, partial [Bacteroidia bacterium]|nr:PAS domain-containing sensor histidine kinase [Bacteroidia bacterium]